MQQNTPGFIDYKTAIHKAEAYCSYQERSQYEVRGKLINLGVRGVELENIIVHLIENNFLNEERFALAYAQGKLRMKSWGRKKITQGLKFKQVSAPLIKRALSSLNEDEYLKELQNVIEKKDASIKEKNEYQRRYKLTQYAMSRGFEQDLIFLVLKTKEL